MSKKPRFFGFFGFFGAFLEEYACHWQPAKIFISLEWGINLNGKCSWIFLPTQILLLNKLGMIWMLKGGCHLPCTPSAHSGPWLRWNMVISLENWQWKKRQIWVFFPNKQVFYGWNLNCQLILISPKSVGNNFWPPGPQVVWKYGSSSWGSLVWSSMPLCSSIIG